MAYIQERIKKSGEKSCRVQIKRSGQPIQTATFKNKTTARKWATKIEAELDAGKHFKTSPAKEKTLADAIDRYIETALPVKGKSTQIRHKQQLGWWKSRIGRIKLSHVKTALILESRDFMIGEKILNKDSELVRLYSNATINRYIVDLSAVLSCCIDWDWLEMHPIRQRIKTLEENKRTRFLNHEERKDLLTACKNASCSEWSNQHSQT